MTEARVAIVTGASSGIGAATARKLARRGLRLLLNYAGNTEGAETVLADCRASGAEVRLMRGDVGEDATCRAIAAEAMDQWGRIDILVNNAGMTRAADPADLDAISAEDFHDIYRVNLVGAYQMIRAVLPGLRAGGNGCVVNTSSIAGITGMGSSIAYAASKGAMNAMTLGLARSLAPEVRVNAVCPGFVDSEWWAKQHDAARIDKIRNQAQSVTLLNRVVTSEDVAEAILHLALHAPSTTGLLHVVDAGLSQNIGQPLR